MGKKAALAKNGNAAYKWNTAFMTWYTIRLVIFIVGGFISLLLVGNNRNAIDYFCNRYWGLES